MTRVRALALIALVIAWTVPAGGSSCPSNGRHTGSAHVHENDAAGHSHDHASADSSSCCKKRASSSLAIHAALQDAQPRPKPDPLLSTPVALAPAPVEWTSGVELRHQPPPRGPYARTRRPLLI